MEGTRKEQRTQVDKAIRKEGWREGSKAKDEGRYED